jgi:hypothetical protein
MFCSKNDFSVLLLEARRIFARGHRFGENTIQELYFVHNFYIFE